MTVQVWPTPSLTNTVPVGVPEPGAFAATLTLMVIAWFTTEGFGVFAVTVVLVTSLMTSCGLVSEPVLPLKFPSPP